MRKINFLFSFLLIAFSQISMYSQTWTNYRSYSSSECLAIEKNHVWIGTSGGLLEIDTSGNLLNKYPIPNGGSWIFDIAIDKKGNKWVSSFGAGVSKFDGTTWTNYNTKNSGLTGDYIPSIGFDSSGNTWFGTQVTGLSKFDGTTWTTYQNGPLKIYTAASWVNGIVADTAGNMWFGCGNPQDASGGLTKYDGTKWTSYQIVPTASYSWANVVRELAIDSKQRKWMSTDSAGASLVVYNDTTFKLFTAADGLLGKYVYAIAVDSKDNIWIATDTVISMYNGTTFTNYFYEKNGLPKAGCNAIDIDDHDNVWIATESGVLKFNGSTWITFPSIYGGLASNGICSIQIDSMDNKWFATNQGVQKFDGTNWTMYYDTLTKLLGFTFTMAFDSKGNKWFGGRDGVAKYDGTNWTLYNKTNGLISNFVNAISFDMQGNKWFATDSGISEYDGTNWTNYSMANGLPSNRISIIAFDAKGNKWIGTSNGLSKFDGTTFTNYLNQATPSWTSTSIGTVVIDTTGTVWFGGYNIDFGQHNYLWKLEGNIPTVITPPGVSAGFYVSSMAIDPKGNMWIGTYGAGVFKYNGINWKIYTTKDGAPDNNFGAIAFDKDGNKWFACAGVTKLVEAANVSLVSAKENGELVVYPVPADNIITVEYEKISNLPAKIVIYDMQGKIVSSGEITKSNTELNVGGLATGMYLIRITDDENIKTGRFIKE